MSSQKNILLGGGQYIDKKDNNATRFVFARYSVEEKSVDLIDIAFLAHGVTRDPNNHSRIVTCEKIGPGAAILDIDTMQLLDVIETPRERLFYGHCEFSADGKYLYTTETYKDSLEGAIIIRDAQTMEILGEFPSFGAAPHECQIIDEGKTMVVTNGGGAIDGSTPNVAYIDIASQTLVKKETLTNRALNTGHFKIADDEALIVVSAPRAGLGADKLGGVSIQPGGKKLRSISSPKKVVSQMTGEALSTAIQGDTALVTHPTGNMITFWSTKDRRFIKKIDLPKPRGVAVSKDNRRFIVSYGEDASLIQVDAESLEPLSSTRSNATFLTGSHIYNNLV